MNCFELMALRKIFFLEIHEICGRFSCSRRLWRKWESGELEVPIDIERKMECLLKYREELRKHLLIQFEHYEEKLMFEFEFSLNYYHSFDNYRKHHHKHSIIEWRIYQSIVANMLPNYISDFYLCSNILDEFSRCKGIKKYLYFYKRKPSANKYFLARKYINHRKMIEFIRAAENEGNKTRATPEK